MQPQVSQREVFQVGKHKFTTSSSSFWNHLGTVHLRKHVVIRRLGGRAVDSQAATQLRHPRLQLQKAPGKPGRAFQLGQCKHHSNFTSRLTVHCVYRGPGGVFRHVKRGHPSPGSGWTERAAVASAPSSPAPPRGTRAPSQTERIPTATAGQ